MNFGTLFAGVLLVLLIANIIIWINRQRRHKSELAKDDAYYTPSTGRIAPESAKKWQGRSSQEPSQTWGKKLEHQAQELKSVRAILEEDEEDNDKTGLTLPLKDFSTLTPIQRKTHVLNYLHRQRGQWVKLHTEDGKIHEGTIVTLTINKVMVRRDKDSPITSINLDDVTAVMIR